MLHRIIFSLIAFVITIPIETQAQIPDLGELLLKDCPNNYLGQYADNHKTKNGYGITKVSGGGIYIGDFRSDKYNGKGMMLAGEKSKISNVPDTYAYIGGWLKGKKQGFGKCYATNGDLIYSGRFENDKPIEQYPSQNPDETKYFSMMETDNGYFIGEVSNAQPDGYGIYLQEDGTIWIGSTKEGERHGVGIFIYEPDAWSVVKYSNGAYAEINSSSIYNARRDQYHEVTRRMRAELWSDFLDIVTGLTNVGSMYAATRNSAGYPNVGTFTPSDSNVSSTSNKTQKHNSSSKKGNDCGTAWMSDSRVYSDYESQLVRGGQSEADIKSIKNKMRQIRTKWQSRGCNITKSPYE